MRAWLVTVGAALATSVAAQATTPTCVTSCIASNSELGGCNIGDIGCFCANKQFVTNLSCCLQQACDTADLVVSVQYATELCIQANVTDISFPPCKSENGTETALPGSTYSTPPILPSSTSSRSSSSTSATSTVATTSPASTTSSAVSDTAVPLAPSASISSALPTSTSSPQSGLSLGAEIGIGVGAGVAAIAFIGLAIMLFLGRRRQPGTPLHEYAMDDRSARTGSVDFDDEKRVPEMSAGNGPHTTHELE